MVWIPIIMGRILLILKSPKTATPNAPVPVDACAVVGWDVVEGVLSVVSDV